MKKVEKRTYLSGQYVLLSTVCPIPLPPFLPPSLSSLPPSLPSSLPPSLLSSVPPSLPPFLPPSLPPSLSSLGGCFVRSMTRAWYTGGGRSCHSQHPAIPLFPTLRLDRTTRRCRTLQVGGSCRWPGLVLVRGCGFQTVGLVGGRGL